jgi:phosphoribosylanthranilate isomerase
MIKTNIKIGSITNLSDARWAAAAGVDFMGFCFNAVSPFFIPPVKAKEIMEWTTGVQVIAEFNEMPLQDISAIAELLEVDFIQVENNIINNDLKSVGVPFIKSIDVSKFSNKEILDIASAYKDAFAFNLNASNNNYDCDFLVSFCKDYPVIWSLNADEKSIPHIIASFKPFAINLQAGFEEKTGLKEYDKLDMLVNLIANNG